MDEDQLLIQTLHRYFGFNSFRPGQKATIKAVLHHQDVLAVLPTGAGKTLLYQLPGYLMPGSVLIVSPLISLMQDQVDRLRQRGERQVVMLNSTLTGYARQQVLKNLASYRFIFASPEALAQSNIMTALCHINISLFVVDEAHCISQWGPDFRPEYLLLKDVRQMLKISSTLLLTATATPTVQTDILQKLGMATDRVKRVVRSVNRPNIFLSVEKVADDQEKRQRLANWLQKLGGGGIVYFSSRKLTNELAAWLQTRTKLRVAAYHAGIPAIDRFRIQQQFMNGQLQVICATSAFGMGIDKDDIRYVIHYHLPSSLENYVQEIGRAGRNQKPALALLLYATGDEQIPRQLQQVELPPQEIIEQVAAHRLPIQALGDQAELLRFYLQRGWQYQDLAALFRQRSILANQQIKVMLSYIQATDCRRSVIMHYFGESPIEQEPCCDCHMPNWQLTDLELPPAPKLPPDVTLNWQAQLERLFNQSPKTG